MPLRPFYGLKMMFDKNDPRSANDPKETFGLPIVIHDGFWVINFASKY